MRSDSNNEQNKKESAEITQDAIVKASETKTSDAVSHVERNQAEQVLDEVADEAKKAERFDHGAKDAGVKR